MPSQAKHTVHPRALARALAPEPDIESGVRIREAKRRVTEIIATYYECLARLMAVRESLSPPTSGNKIPDYHPVVHIGDRSEVESFRPGDLVEADGSYVFTSYEAELWSRLDSLVSDQWIHVKSPRTVASEVERALSDASGAVMLERITVELERLAHDQYEMIVDAGRRNGWLEVGDE